NYGGGGGTYPNLFDAHPPFQIDGNFGATAGMVEMWLQSQLDEVHLLPALPDAWKDGQVTGLKARGAFEVEISWKEHKLMRAGVKSLIGGVCKVRTNLPIKVAGINAVTQRIGRYYITTFATQKGKSYHLLAG
ncbi:MAG: glycoside hydrolase family 95 protein, partial [Bacteroidota bacterium]|nr:glycoside hydrolase family 95 protein [Bacteroidota bacterium]